MTGNTSPGARGGDAAARGSAPGGENDARPETPGERSPDGYRGRHRRPGTSGGNGGSGGHGGPDRPLAKRAAR
ncbi:hypothetical protein [Streptosporangium sp. NPDC023615]|uniref:hypothetical protein n=1 Tax=Streptosporangium sp. NPDC023615 TaxID=3154794 RepID=UPI00343AA5CA